MFVQSPITTRNEIRTFISGLKKNEDQPFVTRSVHTKTITRHIVDTTKYVHNLHTVRVSSDTKKIEFIWIQKSDTDTPSCAIVPQPKNPPICPTVPVSIEAL